VQPTCNLRLSQSDLSFLDCLSLQWLDLRRLIKLKVRSTSTCFISFFQFTYHLSHSFIYSLVRDANNIQTFLCVHSFIYAFGVYLFCISYSCIYAFMYLFIYVCICYLGTKHLSPSPKFNLVRPRSGTLCGVAYMGVLLGPVLHTHIGQSWQQWQT